MTESLPQIQCQSITSGKILEGLVDEWKPLLADIRTRELVSEKWPELGEKAYWNFEQWGNHLTLGSDQSMQGKLQLYKWSNIVGCPVPEDATDGELDAIVGQATQEASAETGDIRELFEEVLIPDRTIQLYDTVPQLDELYDLFDELIEDNEYASGNYVGGGQVNTTPGAFKQIEELFESWTGGSDNEAAYEAYGDAAKVAADQRQMMGALRDTAVSDLHMILLIKQHVFEQIKIVSDQVKEATSSYLDSTAYNLYAAAGAMVEPIGRIDAAFTILETYLSGSPYSDFKNSLKWEIEEGLTSAEFRPIVRRLKRVPEVPKNDLDTHVSRSEERLNSVTGSFAVNIVQGDPDA